MGASRPRYDEQMVRWVCDGRRRDILRDFAGMLVRRESMSSSEARSHFIKNHDQILTERLDALRWYAIDKGVTMAESSRLPQVLFCSNQMVMKGY
jgi:hypothetical protein